MNNVRIDAVYANAFNVSVQALGTIPLGLGATTPNTQTTVMGGGVQVVAGTYLVTWSTTATLEEEGDVIVRLYLNGGAVANEVTIEHVDAGVYDTASRTILLTVQGDGTLTLINASETVATFNAVALTVTKVA